MTKRRDALKAIGSIAGVGALGSNTGLADGPGNGNRHAGDGLTLVDDGEPQVPIVIDDDPVETVTEAADELNYWLEKITGTKLEILTYSEWDDQVPGRGSGSGSSRGLGCERGKGKGRGQLQVVAVGESPLTDEFGISVDHLDEEGAKVVSTNCELVLVGRDDPPSPELTWRGSYYAVLEFVRSLGVRWIWPGELGEVYPEKETLTIEPDEWEWNHHLPFARAIRSRYYSNLKGRWNNHLTGTGGNPIDDDIWEQKKENREKWTRRHRASPNRPGSRDTASGNFYGHSFQNWWDEYADEHPDWFAKPPEGSSHPNQKDNVKLNKPNPELQDKVFEVWHENYQEDPLLYRALNANPNDGPWYDTRETSREWDEGRNEGLTDEDIWLGHRGDADPVLTERFVRFWNILAERVTEVDPDAWVTSYAYLNYEEPPVVNDLHPNIVVGHVGFGADYPDNQELYESWQGWADAGNELMFWRPNLLRIGHGLPYVYSHAFGEDLNDLYEQGNIGLDFDAGEGHWATQGPIYYVLGEKMYRPEATADEILAEWYNAFGEASAEVQEYFNYWEELTVSEGTELTKQIEPSSQQSGQLVGPKLYTEKVLDEAETILNDAEAAAADDEKIYQDRVEFLRTGFEHTKRTVDFLTKAFKYEEFPTESRKQAALESADTLRSFRYQNEDSRAVQWYVLHTFENREHNLWRWVEDPESRSISNVPDDYSLLDDSDLVEYPGRILEDWADNSFTGRESYTETPYAYDAPDESEWTTRIRNDWSRRRDSYVEDGRMILQQVQNGDSRFIQTDHSSEKTTGNWEVRFRFIEPPGYGSFDYQFISEDYDNTWFVRVHSSGTVSLERRGSDGPDPDLEGVWDVDTEEHTLAVTRDEEATFNLYFDDEHIGEYKDTDEFLPPSERTRLRNGSGEDMEIIEIRSY